MSATGLTRQRVSTGAIWLIAIAALAAGRLVTDHLPNPDTRATAPFVVTAGLGQSASMRSGDLAVTEVTAAPTLSTLNGTLQSPGLFVRVTYRFTPNNESGQLLSTTVSAANGWSWSSGIGERVPRRCATAPPGVPAECAFIVEAPADRLVGAHAVFAANPDNADYDSQADIDLGISPEDIATWRAATKAITLPEPTLGDAS
ncbi:MAG: hypothetical protein ACK5MP_06600 [Nostocoides sp.]